MTKKNAKVRKGNVLMVTNTKRGLTESPKYAAVWVEDSNGSNERCLLLTWKEWSKLSCIVPPAPLPVKGRLYQMEIAGRKALALEVVYNTVTFVLSLSAKRIAKWEQRAKRNPEDIPKKSLFVDLLD